MSVCDNNNQRKKGMKLRGSKDEIEKLEGEDMGKARGKRKGRGGNLCDYTLIKI